MHTRITDIFEFYCFNELCSQDGVTQLVYYPMCSANIAKLMSLFNGLIIPALYSAVVHGKWSQEHLTCDCEVNNPENWFPLEVFH